MKVSLNTVKQFVDFELPPIEELVARINEQLGGVEEVIHLGEKYENVLIVRIDECALLEGSDHLHVVKIDDGGVQKKIERDENGKIQVVCGAPNVRSGMLAVWLAPGTTVPSTFDDQQPFVLSSREVRGVLSNGMLASPKELAFGDSHEGILEIDPQDLVPGKEADIRPGVLFADIYGLDDYIIDIENKMFTHRPDCFGVIGIAREIAGILHKQFRSPNWYTPNVSWNSANEHNLLVENNADEKVSRFLAVVVKDVTVKPSPLWLQAELVRLGAKPINNVVDITNYIMLLTAQPMHAYDYSKVGTSKIDVRLANDGEALTLLGGKTIALNRSDIIITDGQKPIGLGGIMGGAETEVSNDTTSIILECATFDMFSIRRTSMRHGLFTDASTRFTKGQSNIQNGAVMKYALQLINHVAGGVQASEVVDLKNENNANTDSVPMLKDSQIDISFINERLGLELSLGEILELLSCVEFIHLEDTKDGRIGYRAPFWRTDIHLPEDLVEEVGRLYGFHSLPQQLPRRSIAPALINDRRLLKEKLRNALSTFGANEVLTYSFVHKNMLERIGQDVTDAYQLTNALSPDLHFMRLTVLPSLIEKIHANVRAGYSRFALFEIGKGHSKKRGKDDQGVPLEQEYISLAIAGGDYYDTKLLLENIAEKLHIKIEFEPIKACEIFEPKRSASITYEGKMLGIVGEFQSVVQRHFKLPKLAAGFEIDLDALILAMSSPPAAYRPLSKYPPVERDITLSVHEDVLFKEVQTIIEDALKSFDLIASVSPENIYKPEASTAKNITFHISLVSTEKTLTSEEANDVINKIGKQAELKVGAKLI